MQSIDQSGTNGERLATQEWGVPENPRIVLVHGFTQSARSWSRLAPEFADAYCVVGVDLPGHGRSSDVPPADLTQTARLVGEAGGRAIYVGYSLGGRVALTLALDQPELVNALVLVSASPGISDAAERALRRGSDRALAECLDPSDGSEPELSIAEFLDAWLARPLFRDLDEVAQDRASRIQNSPRSLAQSLRATGAGEMQPLQDRLFELKMPVLCLAGERDLPYVERAKLMATEIGKNAQSFIIGDAGHALCFEQPTEFLRVVNAFLRSRMN